jgi:hypothetical protein
MEGAHHVADQPTAIESALWGGATIDVALAELRADEGDDRVAEIERRGAQDGERLRLGRDGVEDWTETSAGAREDRGDPRLAGGGSSCHRLRLKRRGDEHWQSYYRDYAD